MRAPAPGYGTPGALLRKAPDKTAALGLLRQRS